MLELVVVASLLKRIKEGEKERGRESKRTVFILKVDNISMNTIFINLQASVDMFKFQLLNNGRNVGFHMLHVLNIFHRHVHLKQLQFAWRYTCDIFRLVSTFGNYLLNIIFKTIYIILKSYFSLDDVLLHIFRFFRFVHISYNFTNSIMITSLFLSSITPRFSPSLEQYRC